MTHDEAFLRAIRDEPDDDAPRLIYADWLEDHGQGARAEFIRVQCERAWMNIEALKRRAWQLLVENWEAWVGPLRELVGQDGARLGEAWLMGGPHADALFKFQRGFVESLTLRTEVLLRRGDDLARLTPLQQLLLWGADACAPALAASPHLEGLRSLALVDCFSEPLTAAGAKALASSPHLGRLRMLFLDRNNIGDEGFRALARAPWLTNVQVLYLNDNGLSAEGVRALAGSNRVASLTILSLAHNGLEDEGLRALAASPHLGRLCALFLNSNNIGDEGARALAASPHLARLNNLELRDNRITAAGEAALRASPYLRQTRLHL